ESVWPHVLGSGEPLSVEYSLPIGGGERQYEARLIRSDNDTVVIIVRDITTRFRAEEDLLNAQVALARVSRIRSLGEVAAGIAHEVSQPIAAMITNARA